MTNFDSLSPPPPLPSPFLASPPSPGAHGVRHGVYCSRWLATATASQLQGPRKEALITTPSRRRTKRSGGVRGRGTWWKRGGGRRRGADVGADDISLSTTSCALHPPSPALYAGRIWGSVRESESNQEIHTFSVEPPPRRTTRKKKRNRDEDKRCRGIC